MSHFYNLSAVIWKEGKHYVSKCPELGVASYGATPEKANKALEEAVALYLRNAKELGLLAELRPTLDSPQRYHASLRIKFA